MEHYGGYLTTVEGRGYLEGSACANPTPKFGPGPKPKHKRKEREQLQLNAGPNTHHTSPAAISPAIPAAPFWNPISSTKLENLVPVMARLSQDMVVKTEEGTDLMGSLDPHYFEQYGGAASFPPVIHGNKANNASFCDMVDPTSQLPALARPLSLPWSTGFAGFNDNDLVASMAPPKLTMAMDPLPSSISHPVESVPSAGDNSIASPIPLLCHICPKKPNFSDVSHLLTHISSKSHLAARFKLQLSDDASDKQALHHFDQWAGHYGINKLLKNRQDAKELKKQNNLKRQRGGNEKRPRRSTGPHTDVKLEPGDNLHLQLENNPLNQGSWYLHTPHTSFNDPYRTPPIKRAESIYPLPDSPQDAASVNSGADAGYIQGITDAADGGSGVAKLKGIVLPGMDLFDAATPDQRRMRNQKKHESVLRNMTKASESIEQTEYVWDDQFLSIARTRNVYDSPSVDGSPESKDEEVPVVKKRRARRVVSTGNGPQRQTRHSNRGSKASKRGPTRAAKKARKSEQELESEDEKHDSQVGHAVGGFEHNINDSLMGADVFAEPRLGMPGVTDTTIGDQHFNLAYRNAMQGLPPNRPMSSMFMKTESQPTFGFYDKENDRAPFALQQSGTMPGTMPGTMQSYFPQSTHNMQSSGLNPLCVQRQDSPGFPYMFSGQTFDPPKSTPTPFQPMNVMEYNSMTSGSQFQTGTARHQNGAFDL